MTNVNPDSAENQFVPATNTSEADVDFASSLDNQELNKAYTLFGDHGIMNFTKMVKDGVAFVHKSQNGVPLKVDTYETSNSQSFG